MGTGYFVRLTTPNGRWHEWVGTIPPNDLYETACGMFLPYQRTEGQAPKPLRGKHCRRCEALR